MNLSAWALSIVGIVLLTLIVDIVLPEGETNKYIKSVFAVITVFVIASPIPSLFNGNFNFDDFVAEENASAVDGAFLEELFVQRAEAIEKELLQVYVKEGVDKVEVDVIYSGDDMKFTIEKILLDIQKAVIVGSDKNINIKEKVLQATVKALDISQSKVEFL